MPQHFGTMPMPLMWTFYWFAMRYMLLWLHSVSMRQEGSTLYSRGSPSTLRLIFLQTLVAESILESLFLKYNVRKEFRVYFVGLFCATGCIVNVVSIIKVLVTNKSITVTKLPGFSYYYPCKIFSSQQSASPVIHLIYSRIIFAGISIMPLIESTFILLVYGLSVFVDDIHFKFGSPPSFFWRFCWRALPFILLVTITNILVTLIYIYPLLGKQLLTHTV